MVTVSCEIVGESGELKVEHCHHAATAKTNTKIHEQKKLTRLVLLPISTLHFFP